MDPATQLNRMSIRACPYTFVEIDYCQATPFRWIIQEWLLSVTSESIKLSSGYLIVQACPGNSVLRWTDSTAMTITGDLGRNAWKTNPLSCLLVAVGNVSGYRCVSDCRSRGREFDPGLVLYFRGDWSWNNFYGHSPPFRWFIQEGLLSVTSESMCTNYWLTACSSLPRKKCG